jgi:type III secretion system FlhB-like substrate exporter
MIEANGENGGMNMQYYYGNQMPLRILDEAEFWKHQEEEHTVVIREFVPNLEQNFVDALKQWETSLAQTHQQVIRYIESVVRIGTYVPNELYHQVLQLVSFCLQQSQAFIQLCEQIKTQSSAVSQNTTAKVVLNHISRESEYFSGIAQALISSTSSSHSNL